ncbi:AAA family ATPase [Microvirga sp. CF3062]|uniref:AAA family ATPase n=1 Tax=Microvirga sp. CF3062 TaxID=3110182 RepID=UPI002E75B742|nr:AAA family ATPase [Microvirga sp. CF3062]MEE1656962.1 AAA family ATPase [Microvirga sp. CF3062]
MTDRTLDTAGSLQALAAGAPINQLNVLRDGAIGAQHNHSQTRSREAVRIPHISIDVFCETQDVTASMSRMAADRQMARARVGLNTGGIKAAARHYAQNPTPNLVLVESRSTGAEFLEELDRLAEVCDAGTRVMAVGGMNDITFYRELLGRGVSEYMLAPVDPLAVIEAISRIYGEVSSGRLGQVYAFVGAKGGVGSSTLAHNVAWTLARRLGSNVVLADMDLPFGTAGLDFNVDGGQGIAEAIKDVSRLDEVLFDRLLTRCGENLSLLSAPVDLTGTYDLQEHAIERLLEVAQASVPFMILDMPHLWTAWAKKTLLSVDEIVITATPDLASLRNAKAMFNILQQSRPHDPPPKLVLNQVGMPKRPEIKPNDFTKALQTELMATVFFDANLFGSAANKGQMIAEVAGRSPAAKAFGTVAEALAGRRDQKSGRKGRLGLGSLLDSFRRKAGERPSKRSR